METILITGGTGMIGTVLSESLAAKGYEVIVLTRGDEHPVTHHPKINYAAWNPDQQWIDPAAIGKADHIIHLAGANVAGKRWSEKRKKEIVDSRVKTGQLLVSALSANNNKVRTVITASAIGWYGPDPIPVQSPFTEDKSHANDFLGQTCWQWESSLDPVTALGKRLVKLRTGIVLSKKGGALDEFKKPLRFGVATILGTGKQVISWIHLDDLVNIYIKAVEDDRLQGAYNAVAPAPVTNKELVLQLARAKNKWFIPLPVPSFVLKIALGEMSIEVLKSATVSAARIQEAGYRFVYPTIKEAIQHV